MSALPAETRQVRVRLEPVGDYEGYTDYCLSIDVCLDAADRPVKTGANMGVRGGLARNSLNVEPFVFHPDGTIDYGSEWEDERFAEINLLEAGRTLQVREFYTYSVDGAPQETIIYRVVSITPLPLSR